MKRQLIMVAVMTAGLLACNNQPNTGGPINTGGAPVLTSADGGARPLGGPVNTHNLPGGPINTGGVPTTQPTTTDHVPVGPPMVAPPALRPDGGASR
jgi:hypothetical protein